MSSVYNFAVTLAVQILWNAILSKFVLVNMFILVYIVLNDMAQHIQPPPYVSKNGGFVLQ